MSPSPEAEGSTVAHGEERRGVGGKGVRSGPQLAVSLSITNCIAGLVIATAVFAVGTAVVGLGQFLGRDGLVAAFAVLDSGPESTIPTWFSTMLLLSNAVAAGLVGKAVGSKTGDGRYWTFLAVVLAILSIDEIARFHERTIGPLRTALGTSGLLYYAWVIPGLVIVLTFGVLMFPFWRRLPARTRIGLLVAGGMYVGGALGLEMVSGLVRTRYGIGVATGVASLVEEAFEMLGATALLWVLLDQLRTLAPTVTLSIRR